MRFSPICTEQDAALLRDHPSIAVDVGFAKTGRKTCGVAASGSPRQKLSHAECLDHLVGWMSTKKSAVLILEAPLSLAFANGNPSPRGNFERSEKDGKSLTRYWYSGPGAAVALGASNILSHLATKLHTKDLTIHLVEGFVSFGCQLDHHKVALALHDSFLGLRHCQWHSITEGDNNQSLLDFIGISSALGMPAILIPSA